jgi:hypothetical protein
MMNYAPSPQVRDQATAELELRRRQQERELEHAEDLKKCRESCEYFCRNYVFIYDATPPARWLLFDLWPAQVEIIEDLESNRMVVILKARQLGMSWVVLAYALWVMLFQPNSTVAIFSQRDDEAVELLDQRLKGMHERLPDWLRPLANADAKHQWAWSNGSRAIAFPTTGGRSYTGTLVIVDEADHIPDLARLMNAVEPLVDAGGQMVILSTPDKSQPQSLFKKIYIAAKKKLNEYKSVFFGWRARPSRTQEWYETKKRASLAKTGSLDDLHQEYPENDIQALAPNSLDKRLPQDWLLNCYQAMEPLEEHTGPSLVELKVYREPERGVEYVMGADPAEGNPTSDDSSLSVVNKLTGEEVAQLAGKFEPKAVFGPHIAAVSKWYNKAAVLVERNNHGHAVIGWLQDHAQEVTLLKGTDDKAGWMTTSVSKALMYSDIADMLREGDAVIHDQDTYLQLSGVEGATLNAPKEEKDDCAVSFVLSQIARARDMRGEVTEDAADIIDDWF